MFDEYRQSCTKLPEDRLNCGNGSINLERSYSIRQKDSYNFFALKLYYLQPSLSLTLFFLLQDEKYQEMKQKYADLYARLSHIKKLVVEYDQKHFQVAS